jgi:hypothetical protein
MKTWLWPNRTISKTESAKLRDEHNATVNTAHELLTALRDVMGWYEDSNVAHLMTKIGEQAGYQTTVNAANKAIRNAMKQ